MRIFLSITLLFAFVSIAKAQHHFSLSAGAGLNSYINKQTEVTSYDGHVYDGKGGVILDLNYTFKHDSIGRYITPYLGLRMLNSSFTYVADPNPNDYPEWPLHLNYFGAKIGGKVYVYKGLNVDLAYNYLFRSRFQNEKNKGAFVYMDYDDSSSEQMIQVGVSYNLKKFNLGLNYAKTLTPIRKADAWSTLGNEYYHSMVFLSLEYLFLSIK